MPVPLSSPDHPIWDIAELIIAVLIVYGVLWHNASNFDRTETISVRDIGVLLGVVFAVRSGARWYQRKGKENGLVREMDS